MRLFLVSVLVIPAAGCPAPAPGQPPAVVRAADLVRAYRDDPLVAKAAYTDRLVLVALTNPVAAPGELRWHLGDPGLPPALVCRFAGPAPPPGRVVWVEGVCRGRARDRLTRDLSGYDFVVTLTACRPATAPISAP